MKKKNLLENVQKELENTFEVLEYENNASMKVRCKRCNNIFKTTLETARKSKGCINCNGRKAYTLGDLEIINKEKFSGKYLIKEIFIKEYKNCKKTFVKVEYKNREYSKSISEFIRFGFEREISRNIESIRENIELITDGHYTITDSIYDGRKAYYTFLEIETGRKEKHIYDNFLKKPYFKPDQNISSHSIEAFKILNEENIYFEKEIKLNKGHYRFDIKINTLNLFLEIDGEQHFYPTFGKKRFLETINDDTYKNKYCIDKNLNLLRVHYKDIKNLKNIITLFKDNKFEDLLKFNILLITNSNIFNFESYYAPVDSYIKRNPTENLFNCWKTLKSEMIGQSAAKPL